MVHARCLFLLFLTAISCASQSQPGVGLFMPLEPLNRALEWISPLISLIQPQLLPDYDTIGPKSYNLTHVKLDNFSPMDAIVAAVEGRPTSIQITFSSVRSSISFTAQGSSPNATKSVGRINFFDAVLTLDSKIVDDYWFMYISNLTLIPEDDTANFDEKEFPGIGAQFLAAMRDGSLAQFIMEHLNDGLMLELNDLKTVSLGSDVDLALNLSLFQQPIIVDDELRIVFTGSVASRECSFSFLPLLSSASMKSNAINVIISDTTINCILEALPYHPNSTLNIDVGEVGVHGQVGTGSEIHFREDHVEAKLNITAELSSKTAGTHLAGSAVVDASLNITLRGEKISHLPFQFANISISKAQLDISKYVGSKEFQDEIKTTDFKRLESKLIDFIHGELAKRPIIEFPYDLPLSATIAKVLDHSVVRKLSAVVDGAIALFIDLHAILL